MVDYRAVKKPTALKPSPITLTDIQDMEHAEIANIGVSVGARQLNCKYAKDKTYVVPVESKVEPFKFSGYIAPADCRTWFEAEYAEKDAS